MRHSLSEEVIVELMIGKLQTLRWDTIAFSRPVVLKRFSAGNYEMMLCVYNRTFYWGNSRTARVIFYITAEVAPGFSTVAQLSVSFDQSGLVGKISPF